MRSHADGRWQSMVSANPFHAYYDPVRLALLDQAFEKAVTRVNGRVFPYNGHGESRTIVAERIMALAATGETDIDRLVLHAMRAFPRLEREVMNEFQEQIRRRAYEIWQREGCPEGREREHWEQAVRETGATEEEVTTAVENASSEPPAGNKPKSA